MLGLVKKIVPSVTTVFVVFAFVLRTFISRAFSSYLFDRVELVTPLTNIKRLKEAFFLEEIGLSPYDGSAFHEPPLILSLFRAPLYLNMTGGVNIIMDFAIAWLLRQITIMYLQTDEAKNDATSPPPKLLPNLITILYLYSPFSWTVCAAQSTGTFENLLILLSLYYALQKNPLGSIVCISFATYISLYPVQLLAPIILILGPSFDRKVLLMLFAISLGSFMILSYQLMGSWDWIYASYGFTLQVIDLTPNIGLFWYFFLEVFKHFRTFFCCVLQLNCFLYMIPLSICLRRRPVLLFWCLFTFIAMLKPYPSMADLAVEFGLLPLFYQLVFEFTPRFVIIIQMFLYSSVLMPLSWNAWLYQGSGNANFYYASTLVVGIGQIWLLVEVLHLALERAYLFRHKLPPYAKSTKTE